MREKLVRAAAATKRDWQARLAAVQSEEAALQRKLAALAGEPCTQALGNSKYE